MGNHSPTSSLWGSPPSSPRSFVCDPPPLDRLPSDLNLEASLGSHSVETHADGESQPRVSRLSSPFDDGHNNNGLQERDFDEQNISQAFEGNEKSAHDSSLCKLFKNTETEDVEENYLRLRKFSELSLDESNASIVSWFENMGYHKTQVVEIVYEIKKILSGTSSREGDLQRVTLQDYRNVVNLLGILGCYREEKKEKIKVYNQYLILFNIIAFPEIRVAFTERREGKPAILFLMDELKSEEKNLREMLEDIPKNEDFRRSLTFFQQDYASGRYHVLCFLLCDGLKRSGKFTPEEIDSIRGMLIPERNGDVDAIPFSNYQKVRIIIQETDKTYFKGLMTLWGLLVMPKIGCDNERKFIDQVQSLSFRPNFDAVKRALIEDEDLHKHWKLFFETGDKESERYILDAVRQYGGDERGGVEQPRENPARTQSSDPMVNFIEFLKEAGFDATMCFIFKNALTALENLSFDGAVSTLLGVYEGIREEYSNEEEIKEVLSSVVMNQERFRKFDELRSQEIWLILEAVNDNDDLRLGLHLDLFFKDEDEKGKSKRYIWLASVCRCLKNMGVDDQNIETMRKVKGGEMEDVWAMIDIMRESQDNLLTALISMNQDVQESQADLCSQNHSLPS